MIKKNLLLIIVVFIVILPTFPFAILNLLLLVQQIVNSKNMTTIIDKRFYCKEFK